MRNLHDNLNAYKGIFGVGIFSLLFWIALWGAFFAASTYHGAYASEFRITNNDPFECPDGDCTFLDEDGEFSRNGETIGQLDFMSSDEIAAALRNTNRTFNTFRNDVALYQQTVNQRFNAAAKRADELAAINAALDMIGPTDQGRVKFNLQATTVNDDAQALGLTVVGTRYKNGSARLSYGIGVGSNLSGDTFNEYTGKAHFGVEF